MLPNDISGLCLRAAIEVHSVLRPGLLERSYQEGLLIELDALGLEARAEVPISGLYKGQPIGTIYRADILVEGCVVLECKCVERVLEVHRAQLLTYLVHGDFPIGLLLNFSARLLMDDFVRVVNGDVRL